MTREIHIEIYFNRKVQELGGEVRKLAWVGRRHAPDRLALFPGRHPLVELKRPGETPRQGQLREHERLRAAGFEVYVLATREEVDAWAEEMAR